MATQTKQVVNQQLTLDGQVDLHGDSLKVIDSALNDNIAITNVWPNADVEIAFTTGADYSSISGGRNIGIAAQDAGDVIEVSNYQNANIALGGGNGLLDRGYSYLMDNPNSTLFNADNSIGFASDIANNFTLITGGSGNDFVWENMPTNVSHTVTASLGDGADTFYSPNGGNIPGRYTIDMGKSLALSDGTHRGDGVVLSLSDKATINFQSANAYVQLGESFGGAVVNLTDKDRDSAYSNDAAGASLTINPRKVDNWVEINGSSASTYQINGADQSKDYVSGTVAVGDWEGYPAGSLNLNLGGGNDILDISLQSFGTVPARSVLNAKLEEGDDIADIRSSGGVIASLDMGAGADSLIGGMGSETVNMGASGAANTGNVTFRINAYSSLVDGVGAHASVYAGGKKIGEFQANNNATTGQDFTITTAAANLLNGELAILFDNDKYIAATSTAAAQDRNLYIREVEMINPDGSKQALWNKAISTNQYAERPIYDQYNSGAPAGVNSAFDGQNLRTYTPYSTGTIGMAWGGALKFNLDTQVAGIDIADGGNGSDTYLFDRNSGRDLYRDTGTQAGDVDVLKFSADVKVDQIWLSRDAQAKIHVGIIGTNNDAVINGVDQLQAGGKTLAAADFDKLIQAMASVTPPTMGQIDLNATQHQKLDAVIAANWH